MGAGGSNEKPTGLTERQQKWFASVQASLERNTGKSMDEWVAIARTCPETGQRAQLKWLKDNHGLLQNHGMQVLNTLSGDNAWRDPGELLGALWTDAGSKAIFEAVDAAEPPLRLVLGSTTIAKFRAVYEARLSNWNKWEAVSNAAQGTRAI